MHLLLWFTVTFCSIAPMAAASGGASQTQPAREPAGVASPAVPQELLDLVGPEARLYFTPHFVIASDAPQELVDELLSRLERTRASIYRFCQLLGLPAAVQEQPLEVLFFRHREAYDRYTRLIRFDSQGTQGVYDERTNRSAFFDLADDPTVHTVRVNLEATRIHLEEVRKAVRGIRDRSARVVIIRPDGREQTLTPAQAAREIEAGRRRLRQLEQKHDNLIAHINRTVIQHEIAHQVLFNAGVHRRGAKNPRWVVEGLAMLFETPPGRDGAGFTAVNYLRLQDLREVIAGDRPVSHLDVDDFLAALRDGRFLEPRRLLSEDAIFLRRGSAGVSDYALAWSLMHYLHRVRGGELAGYLGELSCRRPGEDWSPEAELACFERHFGPVDEAFVRRWAGYILSLNSHPPQNLPHQLSDGLDHHPPRPPSADR